DQNLAEGLTFAMGSYVDATYVEKSKNVTCRYRLSGKLELWPLQLTQATYFASPAPLQALGLEVGPDTTAGLQLSLRRRTTELPKGKQEDKDEGAPVKELALDSLPIHLSGSDVDRVAIYEQLFADCTAITIRHLGPFETAKFVRLDLGSLDQVGFEDDEPLFAGDDRVFTGFTLLREFFSFQDKFLGFKLRNLREKLALIDAAEFDILFEFDKPVGRLSSIVKDTMFRLYTIPAANLFEMDCSRIPIRTNEYEHNVVPDRSRWLEFEAHRLVDIFAHYPGVKEKKRVFPIYNLPVGNVNTEDALYYSFRRLPRRPTDQEKRFGIPSNYMGGEMFISLLEPGSLDDKERVRELSVRALCSNRHLPDQLPVGKTGADFTIVEDTTILMNCIAGPTPPRDSIVNIERARRDANPSGEILWKLINLLSFNHLGLTDRGADDPAMGLRELLTLFTDISDTITERRIRGIVGISSRPIVRRLKQETGFNAARGIEITVTFDEKAFEGTGIMIFGAVLDRFFAEYTSINSFTETVVRSARRGVLKRWPPRSGTGQVL
ncbi:MAG: type VI secretion system baseplate subunit TssF, partial [Rhizobiaceae bacterium]